MTFQEKITSLQSAHRPIGCRGEGRDHALEERKLIVYQIVDVVHEDLYVCPAHQCDDLASILEKTRRPKWHSFMGLN